MTDITIQPPLDTADAKKVSEEIDVLVGQICSHELRLAGSYARLGSKLREVKVKQYWQAYGYDRFSSYLEMIREKIDRRRSQVYAILSVAEALLPYMSEDQLEEIGITKAHELRRLVKEGGNLNAYINIEIDDPQKGMRIDQREPDVCLTTVQLMDYAARPDVTAVRLRAAVNSVLHVHEGPLGTWVDFGGAYLTTEEKKEMEQFWVLGERLFRPNDESPEHEVRKQTMLNAARECTSTWIGEMEQ